MTTGEKIRKARRSLGIPQTELADRIGISKQLLYKYETGIIKNIPLNTLKEIGRILDVSPSYLADFEDSHSNSSCIVPPGFQPLPAMVSVPMIGRIACGEPITAEENLEGHVSIPETWCASFALMCKGDSMVPKIQDGDLVAIKKQKTVENGQIAAVRISDEATLKKVYVYPDRLELRPINPDYESIVLYGEEINTASIEGLAVGLCRGL